MFSIPELEQMLETAKEAKRERDVAKERCFDPTCGPRRGSPDEYPRIGSWYWHQHTDSDCHTNRPHRVVVTEIYPGIRECGPNPEGRTHTCVRFQHLDKNEGSSLWDVATFRNDVGRAHRTLADK